MMTQDPDTRPDEASDLMEDATNQGTSATEPAEGADDTPKDTDDSAQG